MEMTEVPQIDITNANPNPDAAAMALTGDNRQDLAAIAKEMGVSLDADGNVVEASVQPTPAQTPTPVKAVETAKSQAAEQPKTEILIPAKFQKPDGTVDEKRLEKSSASLDEAIARYRAKEREFQQLQNKVNNPPPGQQHQAPASIPLSPLEVQIARDLIAESAALGAPLSEGHAIAQAKVMSRALEAKYAAEMDATSDLKRRIEDNERARELQGLIDGDPRLLTSEMVDALWNIRQSNPYLNSAPEPWKAAYTFYLGQQTRGGQVKTPTPTGQAAKAPPTPVGPVSRVGQFVNLGDRTALEALRTEQLEALVKQEFQGFRGR